MMKKIIALILTLLFLVPLTLSSAEANLKVQGYKLNSSEGGDHGIVIIIDALPQSLNQVAEGGQIDISDYLQDMFTNWIEEGTTIENEAVQVVFSVRVVGSAADAGTHKVELTMSPFIYRGQFADSEDYNPDMFIDAHYTIVNQRFIYLDDETFSNTGEGFVRTPGSYNDDVGFIGKEPTQGTDKLSYTWVVQAEHTGSSYTNPVWSARTAVALALDYNQFWEGDPQDGKGFRYYGYYVAPVMVTYTAP